MQSPPVPQSITPFQPGRPPRDTSTREHRRLREDADREVNWKRWGPYLSDRQWGTVREDYSPDGSCWEFFPHEEAHARVFRWGEDGLLGYTDRECRLCFGLALWNGKDEILKERLYGLTGPQGNHGEDVKERYWYLDATPTNSYLKAAYHYPQAAFPYEELREENAKRGVADLEYEVDDTGVFDDNRYFDVVVEYAKASANDTLIRITVRNEAADGPPQTIDVMPQVWFRNTWVWGCEHEGCTLRPTMWADEGVAPGCARVRTDHESLGRFSLHCGENPQKPGETPPLLFTENLTNTKSLYGDEDGALLTKDGFHRWLIRGDASAVNPEQRGTKAAPHHRLELGPGESAVLKLRLRADELGPIEFDDALGVGFDDTFQRRVDEADAFYATVLPGSLDLDDQRVSRQAYAGLVWCKQFYHYIVDVWLDGDPDMPHPPEERESDDGRNAHWRHFFARDILSMPDKWEYPWFAAWDTGFHMVAMSRIDGGFAKDQLELFLREWYMHPNGQLPAYEFAFGDVNPPVHAWAVWRVYKMTAERGQRDRAFLASCFQKLLLNFTWWVNRKDPQGHNIFGGGFLGLDNIGLFDRSQPLPDGNRLVQSDGTAWMAFYCSTMMAMAMELADTSQPDGRAYADMASKFFEHFVNIAEAMNTLGGSGLWDREDGFYYDQLIVEDPDGKAGPETVPLKVQSLVGLMPLIAVEAFKRDRIDRLPGFKKRLAWFLKNRRDLARTITSMVDDEHADAPTDRVRSDRFLLALPSRSRLEKVLRHLFAEDEFFSDYGIRSLSKKHAEEPFEMELNGKDMSVSYVPGESNTHMFGGNSNWRGPIWFPINFLLMEALQRYGHFYGDSLKVEVPTGSGNWMNLHDASKELAKRLSRLCRPDAQGRALFHEYFHGDTGRGCGASHQTGWTSLIARCLEEAQDKKPG